MATDTRTRFRGISPRQGPRNPFDAPTWASCRAITHQREAHDASSAAAKRLEASLGLDRIHHGGLPNLNMHEAWREGARSRHSLPALRARVRLVKKALAHSVYCHLGRYCVALAELFRFSSPPLCFPGSDVFTASPISYFLPAPLSLTDIVSQSSYRNSLNVWMKGNGLP